MQSTLGLEKVSRKRLAEIARQTKGAITVQQAASILKRPPDETARMMARWAQQGWLSRVRRGLYIPVPLEARSADIVPEDPWIIADKIFSPCYIGGWSAAEYWNLTEQIYRTVLVMTTRKPRDRKPVIKATGYVLRSISPDSLFGTKPVWRGQVRVQVSDPTRTLLDMLDDPSLGGGLRPVTDIFQAYMVSKNKNLTLLIEFADRLGNRTVFKRLGFLTERFSHQEEIMIDACRSRLSQGNSKIDPALPAERLITAWKLWVPSNWAK